MALRVVVLLGLLLPCVALAQEAPCGPPAAMNDGWEVAPPDAVGFIPATLCGIGPRLTAWSEADIHSVLVIRHGTLVYEHYFAGEDQRYGQSLGVVKFNAETNHDLRSITKSVTALILGIEIGKGRIAGVDLPVLAAFPEYADLRPPEKDKITLRHLLAMSQGLAWDEDRPYSDPRNSEIQMDEAPDPVRYALAQPVQEPAGTVYNYSGGSATIIAALLHKVTGQTLDSLARNELFEPLGITDFEWIRFPSGEPVAASGLRMRPRDLAKIGQLVLNHGVWKGAQVVPADWVGAATSPQINGQGIYFYGYQFWLGRSFVLGRGEVDWAAGWGYGGQRLFIVPALDIVVLVHAGRYDSSQQSAGPMMVLNRYVLPATEGR
jgi:CubicO group peptidase (beta-lactamase class C family)